jgi:hypothetical protein
LINPNPHRNHEYNGPSPNPAVFPFDFQPSTVDLFPVTNHQSPAPAHSLSKKENPSSPTLAPKKNEAPCGLLFRAALQLHFYICVSYLSSLFQAFPSYPPCRWAELTLD